MSEEIKDAAITLLQTLINATGAEPEDERLAIQIIAKTMQEVVNENNLLQRFSKRFEIDFEGHLKADIQIEDNTPHVRRAVNGYGEAVNCNNVECKQI